MAILITVGWAIPTVLPMVKLSGKSHQIVGGFEFLCLSLSFVAMVVFYARIMRIVKEKKKILLKVKYTIKCKDIE